MSKSEVVALPPNSTTTTREERVEDCQKAYDLRLKGLTYKQIGEKLEVSESEAFRRCNFITALKLKGMITKDDHLKAELNDKLDELLSRWFPLAMDPELDVGETRVRANGQEYDIALPAWEASSTATKHVMEILREKARINGMAPKDKGGGSLTPETAGQMAAAMWDAMHKLAGGGKKTIKAEVVDESGD